MKKKKLISDAVSKNISRFYFNMDIEKELDEDFDTDELEDYSSDEIEPDTVDILKEDNKQVGYDHVKDINEEMIKMSESFAMMTKSNNRNLQEVHEFIEQLQ